MREIAMRARVYPVWVNGGKMKPEKSAYEMEAMKAVLATLEQFQRERNSTKEGPA